jgi:hypothetical protein
MIYFKYLSRVYLRVALFQASNRFTLSIIHKYRNVVALKCTTCETSCCYVGWTLDHMVLRDIYDTCGGINCILM